MKFGPKSTLVAVIAAATLALTACGGGSDAGADGAPTKSLTIGSILDLVSFEPTDAHIGHTMPYYQAVYDTLIRRAPDGTLEPMLATSWEYNADSTVLTLKLRSDVTFSDGAKVDAAAVKANLDHIKETQGRDAYQVASLKSVAVVDDSTVDITLSAPDPAFTYYLTQAAGFVGSPKALGTEEIKTVPDGSGPYELDVANTVKGSQYVFTKRADYWDKDLQKFDKITIKYLQDITARTNALVSGQVDAAILDAKTGTQAEAAGLTLTASQTDWTGLLLYDRDGTIAPELADVRVRQAMNYAFDRQTILDQQLLGEGTVTNQIFGPDSGAYLPELDNSYPYDPAKAKSLLAEAGYPDGFSLKLPNSTSFEAINAVIVQQLADVGIKVTLETVPQANYVSDMTAGKNVAAIFNSNQPAPWVSISQTVSTTGLYNPFKTSTPELQALIDAVRNGGEQSAELAKAVNSYVTKNAWFVPLYRPNQMFYTNSKVSVEAQLQQAIPSLYNYAPAS